MRKAVYKRVNSLSNINRINRVTMFDEFTKKNLKLSQKFCIGKYFSNNRFELIAISLIKLCCRVAIFLYNEKKNIKSTFKKK